MALPAFAAVLSGPLLGKIIDIVMLAAKGIPAAVALVQSWRSSERVSLETLEKDADDILAAHNRVQGA